MPSSWHAELGTLDPRFVHARQDSLSHTARSLYSRACNATTAGANLDDEAWLYDNGDAFARASGGSGLYSFEADYRLKQSAARASDRPSDSRFGACKQQDDHVRMLKNAYRLRISVFERKISQLMAENAELKQKCSGSVQSCEISQNKTGNREETVGADASTQTPAEPPNLYLYDLESSKDTEIAALKAAVEALTAQLNTRDGQLRDVLRRAETERSAFAALRKRLERAVARRDELERVLENLYE